jgi:hypothetical protein
MNRLPHLVKLSDEQLGTICEALYDYEAAWRPRNPLRAKDIGELRQFLNRVTVCSTWGGDPVTVDRTPQPEST